METILHVVDQDFRHFAFNNFYEFFISESLSINEISITQNNLSPEQNIRYKQLINNTNSTLEEIILYIDENSTNWTFKRISSVEKICLILGVSELSMLLTKKSIIIAEWVKLADIHSSKEGAKFVNALLESINTVLTK